MAETAEAPATTETKVEGTGKIVAAGKVQAMKFAPAPAEEVIENKTGGNEGAGAAKTQAEIDAENKAAEELAKNTGAAATQAAATETKPPLTDDELKAEYEKRFPPTVTLTEEQIKAKEQAAEKRMLDLFIENGGTVAHFVAMQELANADLTQLSDSQLVAELKQAGFDDTQIQALRKERYYQLDDAELAEIETEQGPEAKEAILKKKEIFEKRRLAKAEQTKNQATTFFDTLKNAIAAQDLQVQKESEFSSKVDEHFKNVPRKITFQLGKADDVELAPIEFDVPETVIEKVKASLKDVEQRKQNYNTTDSGLNIERLAELEIRNAIFEEALKTSLLEGQTRQVKIFEQTFGGKSANEIGVGGGGTKRQNGQPGQPASAGKVQRVQPQVAKR